MTLTNVCVRVCVCVCVCVCVLGREKEREREQFKGHCQNEAYQELCIADSLPKHKTKAIKAQPRTAESTQHSNGAIQHGLGCTESTETEGEAEATGTERVE